jgi:hypothetical protein
MQPHGQRALGALFLLVLGILSFVFDPPGLPAERTLAAAYRCHGTAAMLLGLMGMVYVTRKQFMPYHAVAVGQAWHELEPAAQTMFLASMRIIGCGWIALSVALGLMLRHGFDQGPRWIVLGIPAVGLAVAVPTLLAVLRVKRATQASPPWRPLAVLVALFSTGLVLTLVAGLPT